LTAKKVVDINVARRAGRRRRTTGCSKAELEELAAQQRRLYEGLGHLEPDNFASGDMKKSIEESGLDDEEK
jgi:hypothetical protein